MFYLYEFKLRCFYVLIYFFFTWFCSYFFCNQFLYILTLPLKKVYLVNNPNAFFHLIFTELTELFFVQTKLATYITFFFLFPIIFYQLWLFLKPGLYLFEKNIISFFVFLSFFLTLLSLFFTYFFILPSACKFFLSFDSTTGFVINLEAKMDKYLSFILNLFLLFYFFFQIPIFFFLFFFLPLSIFFNKSLLKHSFFQSYLIKKRKFFYFVLFFLLFFLGLFFNSISFYDFSYFFLFLVIIFFYELNLFFFILFDIIKSSFSSLTEEESMKKKG